MITEFSTSAVRSRADWRINVIDCTAEAGESLGRQIRTGEETCTVLLFDGARATKEAVAPACASIADVCSAAPPWAILRALNIRTYFEKCAESGWSAVLAQFSKGGLVRIGWGGYPAAYQRSLDGTIRRVHKSSVPLGMFVHVDTPEIVTLLNRGEAIAFVDTALETLCERRVIAPEDLFVPARFAAPLERDGQAVVVERISSPKIARAGAAELAQALEV